MEPQNPCDPNAPDEVKSAGTRLSGLVRDQTGSPRGGVLVSVSGRPETAVSADDGSFTIPALPPASSYDLVALPQAPLVGGRTTTGALACRTALKGVEVRIVEPPASPEVEIVRASGERRALVAFGGIEEVVDDGALYDGAGDSYRAPEDVTADCRDGTSGAATSFRVQVRAPFGAWQDAVLTPFPWASAPPADVPAAALAESGLYVERIDDRCGQALCAQFAYLDEALADPNARCAEVVGTVEGDLVQPLEPFASYHVRVIAEARTDDELKAKHALPARVEGAAAGDLQTSLVPAAVLPIVGADGAGKDIADADVVGVASVAGGRFVVVQRSSIVVIGEGSDALGGDVTDVEGAAQDAAGEDATATANATGALFAGDAPADVEPLAALPAGKWLRVLRRNDEGGAGSSTIQKLYIGNDHASAGNGPGPVEQADNALEPELAFDPADEAFGGVRAISYVLRSPGVLAQVGVNPPDVYLVLNARGFVLVEQRLDTEEARLGYFEGVRDNDPADVRWAEGVDGAAGAALDGSCGALGVESAAATLEAVGATVRTSACFDVGEALGEVVELVDAEVLDAAFDASPMDAVHVVTDARNDRVLVASAADLLCAGCTAGDARPLAPRLRAGAVDVGLRPLGLTRSRVLDCSGGGDVETGVDVLLVANADSADVSVLEVKAGGEERPTVEETGVVVLPASPVGFLDDAEGPTCADPFAWAIADDGRVIPIDMRGTPSVPVCGGAACTVGTRGRAASGAVARPATGWLAGRARSLVGGPGLLGELGYFKPLALKGAAYLDPNTHMNSDESGGDR